jgi:hypothetical protein
MNIRTSYLYYQLDTLPEINFSEQGIIDLAHELYSELSQIGLSPTDIDAFTGAVCNYYVRADQYNFSDCDPLLHTGPIQDWYAIWGGIKAAISGVGKAASAGFNKLRGNVNAIRKVGIKNAFKSGQLKNTFQGVGTRMKQGFSLGQKTSLANQTRIQASKNIAVLDYQKNRLGDQFKSSLKSGTLTKEGKAAAFDQKNQLNALKQGQQRALIGDRKAGSRSRALAERQNVQDVAKGLTNNGVTIQNTNQTIQKLNTPKPQNAPKPNTTNTSNPKPDKPNVTSSQTQNNTPKPAITDTVKQKATELQSGASKFMGGFKDSGGKVMGIGGEGIDTWASNNKAQAATAAVGTAAAAYGAYRLLRGPKQQAPQQSNVNVNIQR